MCGSVCGSVVPTVVRTEVTSARYSQPVPALDVIDEHLVAGADRGGARHG